MTAASSTILFFLIGALTGAVLAALWNRARLAHWETLTGARAAEASQLREQLDATREEASRAVAQRAAAQARADELERGTRPALLQSFRDVATDVLERDVLRPVATNLGELRSAIDALRDNATKEKSALAERMDALATVNQELRAAVAESQLATTELKSALANTSVRATWGEFALRRVIELAGMTEHCDFEMQRTFTTEAGGARPDVIVRLAGDRAVPIDAKTPYADYIASTKTTDPLEQRRLLQQAAQALRQRVKDLAARPYDRIEGYAGFVILFVPLESFLSAAVATDQTLIDDSAQKRIYLASPTLLLCYLQAFAQGWQLQHQAENAEQIAHAGRQLYDSVSNFAAKLQTLGVDLGRAVGRYNEAVGTYISRLAPRARRIADLASLKAALPEPREVESAAEAHRLAPIVTMDSPQLPLGGETVAAELVEEPTSEEDETTMH
ncbi:MAG: DNA recombination protein RmuC [Candidatus Eremiobacteraeota bacterium]|nr:DNA recombination protein RmuC [Candidatus Eremiobacteraeota bacterium]MBV9645983.1 DNA recombination protein RmuC [Candidatus Eremiobacteraeota bacterium]